MQVYMLTLFELALSSSDAPRSSAQEQNVSQFVNEHFDSLKQEARVMSKQQRSWALSHVNDLKQVSKNSKIEELAQLLRSPPRQLAPTENITLMRKAFDHALLSEGLDRWVENPNAAGNKVEARSRILHCFDQQSYILDLSNLQLNTLPPEIGQLAQLRKLYLMRNRLSTLPPEIGQLAQLQLLILENNQLSTLPPEIGQLAQLQGLTLEHNQLSTLPPEIGQLAQLRELVLGDNQLSTLPSEIGQLAQLQRLVLGNNPNLSEIPLSLGTLPRITNLDMEGARIPREVVNAILASTRALRDRQALVSLPMKLGVWKAAMGEDAPALAHIEDLVDEKKRSINEWLTRLERCRDFRGNQTEMARIVLGILESIKDHPEFEEQFFAQVDANLECCEDRAAMSLNEIYTAHLIQTTEEPALKTLIGVAKTLALRKAVMGALAGTEGQGESVETYLRYESALRERLGLVTAIKSGRFTGMGRDLDENVLIAAVENTFSNELFELPLFQTLAMKDSEYKEKYDQIYDECLTQLSNISQSLKEDKYRSQIKQLEDDRRTRIQNLRIDWLKKQV